MVEIGNKSRWKRISLYVLVLIVVVGISGYLYADEPLPKGESGPAADSLARKIMRAVNADAWDEVRAIQWTFAGNNQHLWDRDRNMLRVRHGDVETYLNLDTREGVVFNNGARLPDGPEAQERLEDAWEYWVNDSFWLNPFTKLFDEGVSRSLVRRSDQSNGLLLTFASGGATPGDSYLILPDAEGLPQSWKMWVSIIPVGGVQATWEDWTELPGGAKISQLHKIAMLELVISDVGAASSLEELVPGGDPFLPLLTKN